MASANRTTRRFTAVAVGLLAIVGVCVGLAAQGTGKWWKDNLSGPDSSNFIPSDLINKTNVGQLQVAWSYPYASSGFNPVVVDGVMYVSGRGGALVALDAATGKEIWIHENLNGMQSRGINFWQSEDGKDKRLIFSINSFLQEINATTGKTIANFGVDGVVNMRDGLLRAEGTAARVQSSSPGKVWKNLIIMGSAPGEGYVLPPGDIRAYDVVTGKRVWQFHTVPWPKEYGYDTRPPDNWKYIGGTNNWGSMAVDDERGIVYIPTGSTNYDFYGADRVGRDLFANCILALDARTGRRLWHFQTVHHDLWDLDNVSAPQLVTVMHNGQKVDAVAHAGKTGFLYVLNRVTGEPLWPIEERPVPQTDVPGEQSWPTQPFPTKPPAFARQSFTVDDVNPYLSTPAAYEAMKARVAKAKNGNGGSQGGIFVPPGVDYETVSMPGNQGGSNWGTTAADPQKGMVFVHGVNEVALLKLEDVKKRGGTARGGGGGQAGPGGAAPQNAEQQEGATAYQTYCLGCHGGNLMGAMPGAANLVGVTDRMADDAIKAVVTGGKGDMRPIASITEAELNAVIAYFHTFGADAARGRAGAAGGRAAGARGGRGGAAGATFPPGPVVGSGGAPLPTLPGRSTAAPYPGNGGNGGNNAYPADVTAVPPDRYMSEYGVLGSSTKPPYSALTAYDLNTGTIKWQVQNGDHTATVRGGGPANTGPLGGRLGIVVTKGGLVFQAGQDGHVRAFDEETGKVLWAGAIAGGASGVPVAYELNGRQYFVLVVNAGGGGRAGGAAADTATLPTGAVAFSLPIAK